MITIDVVRFAFYALLGTLAWFGQVPWWIAPLWAMHDLQYFRTFKTKAYKQDEDKIRAIWERAQRAMSGEAGGNPPPSSDRNPTDWN